VAELVTWETHSRPGAGSYAQGVINDQFPDDIDIFVGMMGAHFGTPTEKWGSGTEEEFRLAFARWNESGAPRIMFYFSDAMSSLNQIDPEQLSKRNAFQKDIQSKGLYTFDYSSMTDFQFDLMRHLNAEIAQVLTTKEVGQDEQAIRSETDNALANYHNLLASDPFSLVISLSSTSIGYLQQSSELQSELTNEVSLVSEAISNATSDLVSASVDKDADKTAVSAMNLYTALNKYRFYLLEFIPRRRELFSDAILMQLRLVRLINDNGLNHKYPMAGVRLHAVNMQTSLIKLVESIDGADVAFALWPNDESDIFAQSQMIRALHRDLSRGLTGSIALIDRLLDENDASGLP